MVVFIIDFTTSTLYETTCDHLINCSSFHLFTFSKKCLIFRQNSASRRSERIKRKIPNENSRKTTKKSSPIIKVILQLIKISSKISVVGCGVVRLIKVFFIYIFTR